MLGPELQPPEAPCVLFAGLGSGSLQGLALRRRVPHLGRWLLACAVAWPLCAVLLAGAGALLPLFRLQWRIHVFGHLLGSGALLVVGAMGTATHWLVLRERAPRAWAWILGGAAGWGLGLALLVIGLGMLGSDYVGVICLIPLFGGAVAGPVTGASLVLCLRKPPTHPPRPRRALLAVGFPWLVAAAVVALIFESTYYFRLF